MKNYLFIVLAFITVSVNAQIKTLISGDAAPDIKLKNVDGKTVSFADYPKAKGFIVVFTCNTCPVAQAYEQRVIQLDKKYSKQGYQVIAVNPNDPSIAAGDSYAEMQKRAKEKGYGFPYLFDPGQKVTDAYGATKTPHLFVAKKAANGFVIAYTGAIDNDPEGVNNAPTKFLEEAITAIDANKAPAQPDTKAVGCGVKRPRA